MWIKIGDKMFESSHVVGIEVCLLNDRKTVIRFGGGTNMLVAAPMKEVFDAITNNSGLFKEIEERTEQD